MHSCENEFCKWLCHFNYLLSTYVQFVGGLDSETLCAFEEIRQRVPQHLGGSHELLAGISSSWEPKLGNENLFESWFSSSGESFSAIYFNLRRYVVDVWENIFESLVVISGNDLGEEWNVLYLLYKGRQCFSLHFNTSLSAFSHGIDSSIQSLENRK